MTYQSRRHTEAADAAGILAEFKTRIERLEESGASNENVQLFRNVTETVTCSDSQTVTVGDDAAFVFGQSTWGFDEFSETQ